MNTAQQHLHDTFAMLICDQSDAQETVLEIDESKLHHVVKCAIKMMLHLTRLLENTPTVYIPKQ